MAISHKFAFHNPARNITYYAVRTLGEGGQAAVWGGVDSHGVPIAIKVVRQANCQGDFWAWHNDQETHLLCQEQAFVVRSYDQFMTPDGLYVLVMEPAIRSLDDVIRSGVAQSALTVCKYGCQILSALTHLHSLHRIHRDVTAKNILEFAGSTVKLSDFGIAKTNLPQGQPTFTQLGNPMYLPPELLSFGRWTHQSDIYQLGLVLVSLLLGRHVIPYNADQGVMGQMILDGRPRQEAERLIAQHGDLGTILKFMVCRTESKRFPSAHAAWVALFNEYKRREKVAEEMRQRGLDMLKTLGVLGGAGLIAGAMLTKG